MPRLVYRPEHPEADEFGMVDVAVAGPRYASDAACAIHSDEMDATRHMADGNYYTSKHKFRQATKDHGCIEVGNEVAALTKPRKPVPLSREARRDAIRQSIRQLKGW
jgi:hypothetical protein